MNYKRVWVVALDLSPTDETILGYVKQLRPLLSPVEIHFIHVVDDGHPAYTPMEYIDVIIHIQEEIRSQILETVEAMFADSGIEIGCHVVAGEPYEEVIKMAMRTQATMVFAGKKKHSNGSGIVCERLSRNLPADFLLVPEGFEFKLNKILIATDFSDHASMSMLRGIQLHEAGDNIEFFVHHSYRVPMGYSKSGKTFEQFAELIRANSEKSMKLWLNNFKLKVQPLLTLAKDENATSQILEVSVQNDIDLIIMGSKGHTGVSLALLGSNTLKLLKHNHTIPVLIVKKEGENLNLLDALRRM